MRQTYIIKNDEVSKFGYINKNVQINVFRATILRTQDIKLQPILCEPFYTHILDLIDNEDTTPITIEVQTLIENYIKPFLIPEIERKIIIPNTNKITAKGVGKINDEYERSNEINQSKILLDELKNDAIYYRNRLIDYLDENKDIFPLYKDCNCGEAEGKQSTYTDSISIL